MKHFMLIIYILLYGIGINIPTIGAEGRFGTELDAVPYATGGFYGSMWYGFGPNRVRAITTRVNVPNAITKNGFTDERIDVYAILIDRFIGADAHNLRGIWVGAGMEYWKSGIEREDYAGRKTYDSYMLTFGAGYVKHITSHLYVNPWIAGHVRAFGDDKVSVGGKTYTPSVFTPEGSVKLGWVF